MRSSQEIGESYIFTMSFPAVRFTPGFGMRPTSITTKHQPGLHGAHTGLFLAEVSKIEFWVSTLTQKNKDKNKNHEEKKKDRGDDDDDDDDGDDNALGLI